MKLITLDEVYHIWHTLRSKRIYMHNFKEFGQYLFVEKHIGNKEGSPRFETIRVNFSDFCENLKYGGYRII